MNLGSPDRMCNIITIKSKVQLHKYMYLVLQNSNSQLLFLLFSNGHLITLVRTKRIIG